jgi:hypothetical protein
MDEAKVLMASDDTMSAATIDLARRFRDNAKQLKETDPSLVTALTTKFKAIWDDVRTDPEVSQKITPAPEVVEFLRSILANLKAREASGDEK